MRKAVRRASLVLLAALIITPLAQITMRGVFNVPLAGAEELAKYFLICLTFLSAAYVTREGGQIRMEEFQFLLPPKPRWILQLLIEISGIAFFGVLFVAAVITITRNLNSVTPVLEIPFLAVLRAAGGRLAAAGGGDARHAGAYLAHAASRSEAAPCSPEMDGFLVILAFLVLFMLGFPVVLAIALPCLTYIFVKDLPIDLVAQRTLYSLDSFPLVAVPVFLFVGSVMNRAGISRYIYRFADTAVGRLPGGVAQVNIFGSLIFAGMSARRSPTSAASGASRSTPCGTRGSMRHSPRR